VSLRELRKLAELAVYRELKERKLTMREICQRISVSMGKVGMLSRELKDHFSQPEAEFGLPRRIIVLLWSGPHTVAQIEQALDDERREEIVAALAELEEKGFLIRVKGRTTRFRLAESHYRLVQERWMARVDALLTVMNSLTDTIRGRFFGNEQRAFARSLSFRVRPKDMDRLTRLYEEHVFPAILELDAAATAPEESDSVGMTLSMFWAPESPQPEAGGTT
jgi:hypothetical protein